MTNPNVPLVRRWFEEVWNQRRVETVHELLTAESECHSETGVLKGPAAFVEKNLTPFLAAFPDVRVTVEGTVAEGDEVVVRWSARGTHTGDGMGMAPTGRRVSFRGMTWIRFQNGKMMEGRDCWNQSGLLQALRAGEAAPSVSLE
jgi:steroid delta-isomerase-like uncharacterized protein